MQPSTDRPVTGTVRKEWGGGMGPLIETPEGNISYTPEVIATVAGMAVTESYGVLDMAGRGLQDGLAGFLGREQMSRGVTVQNTDGKLIITVAVVIGYGARINEVANNIARRVRYTVQQMTGLDVHKVVVDVQGVRKQI